MIVPTERVQRRSYQLEAGETYPGQFNKEKRAAFSYPIYPSVFNKLKSFSFTGSIFYYYEKSKEWIEFPKNVEMAIREFTFGRKSTHLEGIASGASLLFDDNMIEEVGNFIKSKNLSSAERPYIIKRLKEANTPDYKDYGFSEIKQKIRLGKTWFKYLDAAINNNLDRNNPDLGDILEARRAMERTSLQWGSKLLGEAYQNQKKVYRGNLAIYLDTINDIVNNFMGLSQIETAPYRQAAFYANLALVGVDSSFSINQYFYKGLIVSDPSINIDNENYWQKPSLKQDAKDNDHVYNDDWKKILEETLKRLQNVHHRIYHSLLDGDQAYEAVIKERKERESYRNSSEQNE